MQEVAEKVNNLMDLCHQTSFDAGWWGRDGNLINQVNIVPCKLALIHSEISEALEGHRKDLMDDHLSNHASITVELADALICIFDLAGALNLPLGQAFVEKMAYNAVRPDHKLEARAAAGGKAF